MRVVENRVDSKVRDLCMSVSKNVIEFDREETKECKIVDDFEKSGFFSDLASMAKTANM